MKNKQCSAYKFANDSFEFQESWFIWEAMLNIPLSVSSDTRTARKKTWPLLATCRVRFITWNTSKSVYLISKHWNWVSKRKKKTHERHNQGIKADFEVRVSDIQSSLTKVCFISSSSYATCTSPTMHLICPPKFCISIVFNFSWDGCICPGEMKNKGYAKFWGANKVHYERCINKK